MGATFAVKGAMAMVDEPRGPSRIPNLLRYQERADTRATAHVRSGKKVGEGTIRPNIEKRVDAGAEVRCITLAVAQMNANEWRCWIALREGVLFRADRTWFVVPPPQRTATAEQTARHYGLRVETVERYDRRAREVLNRIRAAAGLIGDDVRVPVWPVVQSDDALLAWLFDARW